MKKKVLLFVGLFAIGLCTIGAQAVVNPEFHYNIMESIALPYGYEEIELRGDLATFVGPNAIEAGASDDAVYIGFNRSFGNVSISIYNSMGSVVYNTVVNTDVQQVVIIPFTAASGSYTVELSNTHGYADGDFERD